MARDYRKVSEAHGQMLVAHSILSTATGRPQEEVWMRIGAAVALIDFALGNLGTPGVVARDKAQEILAYPSIAAFQPELPFEV